MRNTPELSCTSARSGSPGSQSFTADRAEVGTEGVGEFRSRKQRDTNGQASEHLNRSTMRNTLIHHPFFGSEVSSARCERVKSRLGVVAKYPNLTVTSYHKSPQKSRGENFLYIYSTQKMPIFARSWFVHGCHNERPSSHVAVT